MNKKKGKTDYSEYEKALIKYFGLCILSEGSKIIAFLIFFAFFGLIKEYLVGLLALMLLRVNGGGIHCKHYISCLFISFFALCSAIFPGIYIQPLPLPILIISLIVCTLIGYHLVPITSDSRPLPGREMIAKGKRRTLLIIICFLILICICPYNVYFNIAYWTIIIHVFQLIIAKMIKEVKKECEL